jgi:hypothetical protein
MGGYIVVWYDVDRPVAEIIVDSTGEVVAGCPEFIESKFLTLKLARQRIINEGSALIRKKYARRIKARIYPLGGPSVLLESVSLPDGSLVWRERTHGRSSAMIYRPGSLLGIGTPEDNGGSENDT